MNLSVQRLIFLVNPAAGSGRAGRIWRRLLQDVPELANARLVLAESVDACRHQLGACLAEDRLSENMDAVIAVGGDGTAHLVVDRLLASGQAGRVAFGLIPAGTGSDLARSLGLPKRPLAGWRQIQASEPQPTDAFEIRTDAGEHLYGINITSAGASGAAGEKLSVLAGRGPLSYLLEALRALGGYRPTPCRVTVDGAEFHNGEFFVAAVANGRAFGRGMWVAPRASVDDGLADVVVVEPFALWRIPFRLPQFYLGRHLKWPEVRMTRGRIVRFEPHGPMPAFEVDGEIFPSGPATIQILPKAIQMFR